MRCGQAILKWHLRQEPLQEPFSWPNQLRPLVRGILQPMPSFDWFILRMNDMVGRAVHAGFVMLNESSELDHIDVCSKHVAHNWKHVNVMGQE